MRPIRYVTLLLCLVASCLSDASAAAENKSKNSFVLAPAKDGKYAPWRDPEEAIRHYAGEIVTIDGAKFRSTYFTDVVETEALDSDFSGAVRRYDDHIYLDHPGLAYPYRVTGFLDGTFVMITWRDYEFWKKFGRMPEYGALFLQTKKEPNQPSQPPPPKRRG